MTAPPDMAKRRGLMLVISSPSGAGKTSLAKRLRADYPALELSTSCTTRAPRPGEWTGASTTSSTATGSTAWSATRPSWSGPRCTSTATAARASR